MIDLTEKERNTLADLIAFELEAAGKDGEYDEEYVVTLEQIAEKLA